MKISFKKNYETSFNYFPLEKNEISYDYSDPSTCASCVSDALMFQKMHKSLHRCISSDATAFLPVTCCHICCPFLLQAAISLLLSSIKPAHESPHWCKVVRGSFIKSKMTRQLNQIHAVFISQGLHVGLVVESHCQISLKVDQV